MWSPPDTRRLAQSWAEAIGANTKQHVTSSSGRIRFIFIWLLERQRAGAGRLPSHWFSSGIDGRGLDCEVVAEALEVRRVTLEVVDLDDGVQRIGETSRADRAAGIRGCGHRQRHCL